MSVLRSPSSSRGVGEISKNDYDTHDSYPRCICFEDLQTEEWGGAKENLGRRFVAIETGVIRRKALSV